MKLKDLISVIDDKAVFITSDLLERTVKEIDIIRNEFLLQ